MLGHTCQRFSNLNCWYHFKRLVFYSNSLLMCCWTLTVWSSCVILGWLGPSTRSKKTVGIPHWQSMWPLAGTELLRSCWDPQGISSEVHLLSKSDARLLLVPVHLPSLHSHGLKIQQKHFKLKGESMIGRNVCSESIGCLAYYIYS